MEDQLIIDYRARALQPTLEEVIADLDLTSNYSYPKLRSYLVEAKVCKVREFNSARYAAYVEAALGTVPTSAAELIDAVVESYGVQPAASHRIGLSWTCPILGERKPCDEADLLREAHRINDTILGNRIPQSNIGRAVEYWLGAQRDLDQKRRFTKLSEPGQFDWAQFGSVFLDDTRVRREVQSAVLQKFIWQVKRRMAGLPVTNHLMAVLYGVQGKGKTRAVEIITAPLGPLVSTGDFQRLGDIREVNMFKSFVVVLDEMQRASQADVDRVKNVVTRDQFDYRPMHSNGNASAIQNATFIGTSNRTLDQMIHDPTGNRRFFQIDWSNDVGPTQWEYLNSLNIDDMWRSVDHMAADPCEAFLSEIRAIQGQGIYRNSVGQFFDAVVDGGGTCTVRENGDSLTREFSGLLRREALYQGYRGYCDYMRIRSPLEAEAFYKEVRRMADQEDACAFQAERGRQFNGWRYKGSKGAPVVTLPTSRISLVKTVAA